MANSKSKQKRMRMKRQQKHNARMDRVKARIAEAKKAKASA